MNKSIHSGDQKIDNNSIIDFVNLVPYTILILKPVTGTAMFVYSGNLLAISSPRIKLIAVLLENKQCHFPN